jgi:hypothetical protein
MTHITADARNSSDIMHTFPGHIKNCHIHSLKFVSETEQTISNLKSLNLYPQSSVEDVRWIFEENIQAQRWFYSVSLWWALDNLVQFFFCPITTLSLSGYLSLHEQFFSLEL